MSDIILKLTGKVIHPENGDIIVVYHRHPEKIEDQVLAWTKAIAFTEASVILCQPGTDIRHVPEEEMNKLGWFRKEKEDGLSD